MGIFSRRTASTESPKEQEEGATREELELGAQALPALDKLGWTLSRKAKRPIDAKGRPIPWYTYPAISFIGERVKADMEVFEFGCGQSTLWWADHARHVTSVEHEVSWAEHLQKEAPKNVTVTHTPLDEDGEYCRAAARAEGSFDVIVIDGRDRVNCAHNCLSVLRDDGVVIWDNAERTKYRRGQDYLHSEGFKRLPMVGLGPQVARIWDTSVFYRPANCFGI